MEQEIITIQKQESNDDNNIKEIKNDKLNKEIEEEFKYLNDDVVNLNNKDDCFFKIINNNSEEEIKNNQKENIKKIPKTLKYGIDENGNPIEIKEVNKDKIIAFIIEKDDKEKNYLIDIKGNKLQKTEDDYYCYQNGEELIIIKDFDVQNPELRIYGHRKINFEEIKKNFEENINKNNNKNTSFLLMNEENKDNIKMDNINKNNNINKNRSVIIETKHLEENKYINISSEINIGNSNFKKQMEVWRNRYGKNNDFIENKNIFKENIKRKIPIRKYSYNNRTNISLNRDKNELVNRTDSILKMSSSGKDRNNFEQNYFPKYKKISIPKVNKGLIYNRNNSYVNIKDKNYKSKKSKRNKTLEYINNKYNNDNYTTDLYLEKNKEEDKIKRANLLKNIKEKYNKKIYITTNNEEKKEQKKKKKKTKIDNYIYSNLKKINYMKKNIKVKCSVLKTEVDQIISNFNKNQRNKKNKGNIFTNKENKNYNYDEIPLNKKGERLYFEYGNDESDIIFKKIKLIPSKIKKNKLEIYNNNFQKNNSIIKLDNFSNNSFYKKIKHNKY